MTPMIITSVQNQRVKDIAKLKQKKYRDQWQKFLVEAYYPITFALRNSSPLEEAFICPSLFKTETDEKQVVEQLHKANVPLTEVSERVFRKMSYIKSVDGLLAVAPQKHRFLKDYVPQKGEDFFLVIESIEQLSNVGTLFRLGDNAGANGIIVCDMRADIFNPGVIRSSLGTFFSIPIWESSTSEAIEWCHKHGITTLATTPHTDFLYTKFDMTKPIGIVMGTEYAGLSDEWMQKASQKVKIPMFGQAESLSVSTTAAIMLYEAVRQRGN